MTDKKIEEKDTDKDSVPAGMKRKKPLPSVDYLLKHGDPDTAHLPKTWCETIGYPFVLAMCFAISLLLFHHAPHDTLPPRKKYKLPGVKRMAMFEKKPANMQKEPETKTEL